MRQLQNNKYINDYVIFPSSEIKKFVDVGLIKDAQHFSVRIQKDNRGRYILNNKQDVTISVNTFSQLI